MTSHQQLCLKWENHHTTLINKFETFLQNNTYVDCTIEADGNLVKAHKLVLSICSQYFEELLSNHCDEQPVIVLKDVSSDQLNNLIDYMYRGKVYLSDTDLLPFLKIARSLGIRSLMEDEKYDDGINSSLKSDDAAGLVGNGSNSNVESVDIKSAKSPVNEHASTTELVANFIRIATEKTELFTSILGMSTLNDASCSENLNEDNNINDRDTTENTIANEDDTTIVETESASSRNNGNYVSDADDDINRNTVIDNTTDMEI